MKDVLRLKIGTSRKKVTIKHVDAKSPTDGNPNMRVYLHTQAEDGAEYRVNEIWTKDRTGTIVVKGLWLNFDVSGEKLLKTSLLAKFLEFMKTKEVSELIGKEVILEPKENSFMAVVAYEE